MTTGLSPIRPVFFGKSTPWKRKSKPLPLDSINFTFRLAAEDKARYEAEAKRLNITLGEYVRTALENFSDEGS